MSRWWRSTPPGDPPWFRPSCPKHRRIDGGSARPCNGAGPVSIIKADVGSIGGHIKPSETMIRRVKEFIASEGKGLLIDSFICHTGDDISILSSHTHGVDDSKVHKLCWDAFKAATEVAKKE